jgi:AraC-like DNA-binding protein
VRPRRYAEHAPDLALAPYVECFWTMRADEAAPAPGRVIPDGCADVIVDLAGEPRAYVVGTMRRALLVPPAPRTDLVSVRFHPGAALPFLGAPLSELVDRTVPLDVLWGASAASLADEIASADPAARVARLQAALLRRLAAARTDGALVRRATALMRRARGGVAVADVARALGVGERRLERAFDEAVGLPPKQLARVLRFRAAAERVGRDPGVRWTALAFDAGYADQPHLIREFRALAGVTPAEYAAERRGVGFVQYGDGEAP